MNNTISCIIIEDDVNSSQMVIDILGNHFPNIFVTATARGVKTAKEKVLELRPDFVVLDINLLDGDAFDLLKELDPIFFKIIFITSHDKYAVEAFKFSALDFLLKPFSPEELIAGVKKIIDELDNEKYHQQLETFFHNYGSSNEGKKIVLKNLEAIHVIDIEDIIYINSDSNYSTFVLKKDRKIMVSKTLKFFDSKLKDSNFFRSHQSYLINLDYLLSFDKKNDTIVLKGDFTLPISQSKRKMLIDFLNRM